MPPSPICVILLICLLSAACSETPSVPLPDGALPDAVFDGAVSDSGALPDAVFDGAVFDGAVLDSAVLDSAVFDGALSDVSVDGGGVGDPGVYFIGHSQINNMMPGYFAWLSESAGFQGPVQRQMIAGANLEEGVVLHAQTTDIRDPSVDPSSKYFYFPGRLSGKGTDAIKELKSGQYQRVILAEEHGLSQAEMRNAVFQAKHGVAFPNAENVDPGADSYLTTTYQLTWELGSGLSFYQQALGADAGAKTYLFEMWYPVNNGKTHCDRLNAGQASKTLSELNSWRKRIHAYIPAYLGMAAELNERRGKQVAGFSYGQTTISGQTITMGPTVEVVPVAQVMSVLAERACAGQLPKLTNPNEFFSDNVHASQLGNYIVALVMYARIRGQSPEGVVLKGGGAGRAMDGGDLLSVDSQVAEALQTLVWSVVSGNVKANAQPIAACPGLSATVLIEGQWCGDPADTETIPVY